MSMGRSTHNCVCYFVLCFLKSIYFERERQTDRQRTSRGGVEREGTEDQKGVLC